MTVEPSGARPEEVVSVTDGTGERALPGDIVVRLDTLDELFAVDPHRFLSGSGRLVSGVEELVEWFLAHRKAGRRQRIVVELADGDHRPGLAERAQQAIRRYCDLRIDSVLRQQDVLWRQGMRSLVYGSVLFVVGVALSIDFTGPDADPFLKELLGNGVFLVIAWIGLWYPLDLLFMARQPLKREVSMLARMKVLPVVLRTRQPEAEPATPAAPPPAASE